MPEAKILAIDDEERWPKIQAYLEENHWQLYNASSAQKAMEFLRAKNIDLILLDKDLEDRDYLTLLQEIKADFNIPVIIISKTADDTETIVGLEMGADDFISHPFKMRELGARIKANLRLVHTIEEEFCKQSEKEKLEDAENLIHFGDWYLDRKKMSVLDMNKQPMEFTTGEYQLLETFVLSPNQALTREQLFAQTRNEEFDGYDRAIDVQIARIRKKLTENTDAPDCIKTVRGIGYMLNTKVQKTP